MYSNNNQFFIDKKPLADFLNISIRTINRYIKKYNFLIYRQNNQIKLNAYEVFVKMNVGNLKQIKTLWDKLGQVGTNPVKSKSCFVDTQAFGTGWDRSGQVGTSWDNNREKAFRKPINKNTKKVEIRTELPNVENFLSRLSEYKKEGEIYKQLYKQAREDLKLKQERLDGATYRVGQLEARLTNSVPLIDYRQKEKIVIQLNENIKTEKNNTAQLKTDLEHLKSIKIVYTILLFLILILVPIIITYF